MAEMKERLRVEGGKEGLVDVQKGREVEIPKGLEPWIQRVEEASQVSDAGIKTLTPQGQSTPKVTVPTTKQGFLRGFKKKISDAGRWLSAFIFRLIKIKKGNVEFKEEE